MVYAKDKIQPEYVIPNGTEAIEKHAFQYCESLTSVTIPEGVTSIGSDAFYGCRELASAAIPDGVTSIGGGAFYGCRTLTSFEIPDSVTNIGEDAFWQCYSLADITLPEGLTTIDREAFWGCRVMTKVTIPKSVTSIGYYAFESCGSLADVYYSGTKREWDRIDIDFANSSLFSAAVHCSDGTIVTPFKLKSVSASVNTAENTVEIQASVDDYGLEGALERSNLYVAEYDAQGRLLKVTKGTKTEAGDLVYAFTAKLPESEKYKIMLWDGNNVPLMEAIDDISAIK